MLTFGFISSQSLQKAWIKTELKKVKLRYSNRTELGKKRELSRFRFHRLDQDTRKKYPGLLGSQFPPCELEFFLPASGTCSSRGALSGSWTLQTNSPNSPPFHSWSHHCSGYIPAPCPGVCMFPTFLFRSIHIHYFKTSAKAPWKGGNGQPPQCDTSLADIN